MKGFEVRRPSTPLLLRLGMALTCLPIALFALAVHLGVSRSRDAVNTVGRDATQGITAAQQIKANLSELDDIVTEDLVTAVGAGSSGFPDNYNAKRSELDHNLVLAASNSPSGAAYLEPLANINYALGHYHSLVKSSFTAGRPADRKLLSSVYGQAHGVMDGTLLSQADAFDKANTYVLNNTYNSHKADSAATGHFVVVTLLVVLAVFAAVQLLFFAGFHRLLNVGLIGATVLAAASGTYALARFDQSSKNLTVAREHAFDSVHELARARATAVSARQAEGLLLLDPTAASASSADFSAKMSKLLRFPPAVAAGLEPSNAVPAGAGGYLARVLDADVSAKGTAAARATVQAFTAFVQADHSLRTSVAAGNLTGAQSAFRSASTFSALTRAIDETQALDQATFDSHASAAAKALRRVDPFNVIVAIMMAALVLGGIYARLREYQ